MPISLQTVNPMITNREEVLENALRIFAKMNYEKASQTEIAKACGLSKAGLIGSSRNGGAYVKLSRREC